ncbi:MAG: M6 family metalloprotease domain-containing protein [Planctomycetes bacterium]|nr:M6 family metalloprotease domain-containing protein [Planctomycetota bacterium]
MALAACVLGSWLPTVTRNSEALADGSAKGAPQRLAVRETSRAARSAIAGPDLVAWLGVVVESSISGVRVLRVVPGSPADDAGLRGGDMLQRVGNVDLATGDDLDQALEVFRPGDGVTIAATRGGKTIAPTARLAARRPPDSIFRGSVFKLAAVPIRFADDTAPAADPETVRRLLFEHTGRAERGASVADYYTAQSLGRLSVEGDVLEAVQLPHTRSSYAALPMGAMAGSAFQEASDLLRTRLGDARLADFDGIAFLYGGAPETRSGFALWPHRSTVTAGARRIPYYVQASAGAEGRSIGIHCHEFGHLIGLSDAYGSGHRTGSGDFCAMAIGHRGGLQQGADRPFSLCAQCKMQLGWLEPVIVDPRVEQRIRLRPAASGLDQALLLPLDARCEEYVLLETRVRRAFDAELPSEGLLVWHIGGARPPGQAVYEQPVDLIEAHGVDTFDAALVRTDDIAFPSARCRDITPETTPGVTPSTPRSFRLDLTDIVREADGSVVLTIGVAKRVRQDPPAPYALDPPDAEGYVARRDPITGEESRFYVGPRGSAPTVPAAPTSGTGQERR